MEPELTLYIQQVHEIQSSASACLHLGQEGGSHKVLVRRHDAVPHQRLLELVVAQLVAGLELAVPEAQGAEQLNLSNSPQGAPGGRKILASELRRSLLTGMAYIDWWQNHLRGVVLLHRVIGQVDVAVSDLRNASQKVSVQVYHAHIT